VIEIMICIVTNVKSKIVNNMEEITVINTSEENNME